MAISSYVDSKTGSTLFKVRVSRSSSTHPGVEVEKRALGLKTQAEADRAERKLIVQVERELVEAESRSCIWEKLVDEWEITAKAGDIFIREVSKGTVDDYLNVLRTHTQDWMKLHVAEIDRAMAWRVSLYVRKDVVSENSIIRAI